LRAIGKASFGNDTQETSAHDRAGNVYGRNAVGHDRD
jgi:hypothetical protein